MCSHKVPYFNIALIEGGDYANGMYVKRKNQEEEKEEKRGSSWEKKKSQPEKNQEPAFHPLFVNPKKVEFENVFVSRFTSYLIDGKLSK